MARSPHEVMGGICFALLLGYALITNWKLRNLEKNAQQPQVEGLEFLYDEAKQEQAKEAETARRVGDVVCEGEELVRSTAKLSEEIQRMSMTLIHAVDREVDAASAGILAGPGKQQAQQQPWQVQQRVRPLLEPKPELKPEPKPEQAVPAKVHDWLKDCKDNAQRAQHVINAMQHSWDSYVKFAWGSDELQPTSKKGKASFGGLGATIIDSLDTLHIMGLASRFKQAMDFVVKLNFDRRFDASVFETTIRVVGGMLSVHDLSGEAIFLTKAQELVDRLLHAFETPTGIPYNQLNLHTLAGKNPAWTARASTLAEFGTEQMEFYMLSAKTGKPVYREAAERPIKHLHTRFPNKGLMPIYLNPSTGEFSTKQVSLGAMGDSYYEYLLKVWILFGKNDESYRAMWEQAMDEMLERLIHKTTPSGFTYVAELSRSGALVHKMDHLACFVPGMLALGVHHKAVQGAKAERYLEVAKGLTETCYQMYRRMPSGIAPEYIEIKNGQDFVTNPKASFNLQRPEAVEAFFVLYRVTGDPKYQEYGWEVFSAFETFTRVDAGYTGVKDVTKLPLARDDTMQSFWLAETLKYLYLLFSPRSTISLDEWVLNTEAHPMKIRPWKFNN